MCQALGIWSLGKDVFRANAIQRVLETDRATLTLASVPVSQAWVDFIVINVWRDSMDFQCTDVKVGVTIVFKYIFLN